MLLDTYEQLMEAMCTSDDDIDLMCLCMDPFWLMEQLLDLQNHAIMINLLLWPYSPATVTPKDIFEPPGACYTPLVDSRQSVVKNPISLESGQYGSSNYMLTLGQQQAE